MIDHFPRRLAAGLVMAGLLAPCAKALEGGIQKFQSKCTPGAGQAGVPAVPKQYVLRGSRGYADPANALVPSAGDTAVQQYDVVNLTQDTYTDCRDTYIKVS